VCNCVPSFSNFARRRGAIANESTAIDMYVYLYVSLSVCLYVCLSVRSLIAKPRVQTKFSAHVSYSGRDLNM